MDYQSPPHAEAVSAAPRPPHRIAVRVLIALGIVLTTLAIFAVWVERQALDTDEWVETSSELLLDEEIQVALQEYLVDQLFTAVDVQAELEERLPPEAQALAGPASGLLRQGAGEVAARAFDSPRVQGAWAQANRTAHELLIALVEGESELVAVEGGAVSLDMSELVSELALRVGIGADVASRLPPGVAELEILEADGLEAARSVADAVRGFAIALSLLAFGSFGLAIFLGRGRRPLVVLWSGLGLILAGLAAYGLRAIAGETVLNEVVQTEAARPAGESAWAIGTSLLTSVANTVMIFGALFVVAAWIGSPAASAVSFRRTLAPFLRAYPGWAYGLVIAAALVYFALAPTHGTRAMLTISILALFGLAGLTALRRQAEREHPEAWSAPIDLTPISGRFAGIGARARRTEAGPTEEGPAQAEGDRVGAPQEAPPDAEAVEPVRPVEPDRLERLALLADLHERGVLSDEEMAREKDRILGARS